MITRPGPVPQIRPATTYAAPGAAASLRDLGYLDNSASDVRGRPAAWEPADDSLVLAAAYQDRLAGFVTVTSPACVNRRDRLGLRGWEGR